MSLELRIPQSYDLLGGVAEPELKVSQTAYQTFVQ
jgi:hypothetical protein